MIYTIKSKSKHFNLKRIQFFLTGFKIPIKLINSNQFRVIIYSDWLQQTGLVRV